MSVPANAEEAPPATQADEPTTQAGEAMAAVVGSIDLVGRIFDMCGCEPASEFCLQHLAVPVTAVLDLRHVCRAQRVSSVWRAAARERIVMVGAVDLPARMLSRCSPLTASCVLLRFGKPGSGGAVWPSLAALSLSGPGSAGESAVSKALHALDLCRRGPSILGGPPSLRALGLASSLPLSGGSVARFLRSPNCCQLEALDLGSAVGGLGGMLDSLECCRGSLRALNLSGHSLPRDALATLSRLGLRVLCLRRCKLSPGGLLGLLPPDSDFVAHLTNLDLGFASTDAGSLTPDDVDEVLLVLGRSLTHLSLADATFNARDVVRWVAGATALRELDLSHSEIGASSPKPDFPPRIERGEDEARLLLHSLGAAPALRRLSLLGCAWLSHDGLRAIASGRRPLRLTHDLRPPSPRRLAPRSASPLRESWESLAEAPTLPLLRELVDAAQVCLSLYIYPSIYLSLSLSIYLYICI